MKRISAVALILLLITVFICGCGSDYTDNLLYCELNERPVTVDPQLVQSGSELMIARNIYEGLMRIDASGNIVKGVASEYSAGQGVYTFSIKKDIKWSNSDPLTADDFVFAFRRALNPNTNAPYADKLRCIKNAAAVLNGSAAPESIGVSAADEYTLIISLDYEPENFLEILTLPVCMPCNEDFFEDCNGRYGMEQKTVLSNGSYRMRKWDTGDSFLIRISNNPHYTGEFKPNNAAVLFTASEKKTPLEQLTSNNVDIAEIAASDIESVKSAGFPTVEFENTCWLLAINGNKYSTGLREAFAMTFDREKYSESLTYGYTAYDGIFPKALLGDAKLINGVSFRNVDPLALYRSEVSKLKDKKLDTVKILYYNNAVMTSVLTDIAGNWQQRFGVTINIEASDSLSLIQAQLINTTADMCLIPVTAADSDPNNYLKYFNSGSRSGASLQATQDMLLSDYKIIPVAIQNSCVAYSEALSSVRLSMEPGMIDFAYVIKKD